MNIFNKSFNKVKSFSLRLLLPICDISLMKNSPKKWYRKDYIKINNLIRIIHSDLYGFRIKDNNFNTLYEIYREKDMIEKNNLFYYDINESKDEVIIWKDNKDNEKYINTIFNSEKDNDNNKIIPENSERIVYKIK